MVGSMSLCAIRSANSYVVLRAQYHVLNTYAHNPVEEQLKPDLLPSIVKNTVPSKQIKWNKLTTSEREENTKSKVDLELLPLKADLDSNAVTS